MSPFPEMIARSRLLHLGEWRDQSRELARTSGQKASTTSRASRSPPRLAVDQSVHGRGLSGILLRHALTRSLDLGEQIGIHAVVVDALDAEARTFYERFGFVALTDDEMRLFLPLSTIRSAAKP